MIEKCFRQLFTVLFLFLISASLSMFSFRTLEGLGFAVISTVVHIFCGEVQRSLRD